MMRRPRIVQARLTPQEFQDFAPLIAERHLWTWSDLIRTALKRYWQSWQPAPSDNGVIHTNGKTKTPASKSPANKKSKPKAASRRIKTTVNH